MKENIAAQLFDADGQQVCRTATETCVFYVPENQPRYNAGCDHCDRGIINDKPHRLCPVLKGTM